MQYTEKKSTQKKDESRLEVIVPVKQLKSIVNKLLLKANLVEKHAELVTDCLVEADMCGVSTHGVAILPSHINRIKNGGYNLTPEFKEIREGGAFAVIDSDNSIGFLSAIHCMEYAIEASSKTGIFNVFSINCNTYGAAFYYPLLAVKKGLIGISFCNSPAAMAPWGGLDKLFGTNPFAIGIPCKNANPIVIDMSMSKVAKSKINEARKNNEQIPIDWALDEEGKPTIDPIEAIKGLVLPMGNHKGYNLTLAIDILAGALSGASFLNNVGRFYTEDNKCMNVGQTFIAIDPVQIYGDGFYELMDQYVNKIKNSKSLNNESVRVPGDNKFRIRKENISRGIKLHVNTINDLNKCLLENGLNDRI